MQGDDRSAGARPREERRFSLKKNGVHADLAQYFKKSELIPAIVQQHGTGEVLMLAYMNEESLAKTLETGFTWFYSRSRGALWNKGETSGHVQRVVSVTPDCDDDALLVVVEQTGAACHTGNKTCFYRAGAIYGGNHE
jgi:phosphoribosyl-AMP cyclohydrolase